MRAVWLTDLHLNFVDQDAFFNLMARVSRAQPDVILIGGDLAEAPGLARWLRTLGRVAPAPVYFVLGNHDFYRSAISVVRAEVRALVPTQPKLFYLPDHEPVTLAPNTALVGVDGFGDGRYGDYAASHVMMTDFVLINELVGLMRSERLAVLNALGDAEAARVREVLPRAFEQHRRVVFLTHVPPFRAACWHQGAISDDDFLPFFTCKAVGDALLEVLDAQPPDRELLVLCGHTHGSGDVQLRDNLRVITGGAEYGQPDITQIFEWD